MAYIKHAYLNTRISLLSGGITHPELLNELAISDNSHIESLLQQLNLPGELSVLVDQPEKLDRQLHQVLLQETSLLLRATTGALREFVIYWLRQYEIMNIKAIIRSRAYAHKHDPEAIELVDVGSYAGLSADTLLSTEDVGEILRVIEHYGYADLAQKARQDYEQRQDVFELEAMIDRQYYVDLIQHFRFLDSDEKKSIQPLIGMLLDRINLVWLLRYRINYGMETSHVYYLLVPDGTFLKETVLLEMLRHDNLADMKQYIPSVWRDALENKNTVEEIEKGADVFFYDYLVRQFRTTSNGIVKLICYLFLRQQQLRIISMVFKGRQLGLDPGMIVDAAGIQADINSSTDIEASQVRMSAV